MYMYIYLFKKTSELFFDNANVSIYLECACQKLNFNLNLSRYVRNRENNSAKKKFLSRNLNISKENKVTKKVDYIMMQEDQCMPALS